MTAYAREVIREVARQHGVSVPEILGRCRIQRVFRARMEVAKRLYARGGVYSSTLIGKILKKDHTTILFYLGRFKKKPSRLKWRAPIVEHLRWIRQKKPRQYYRKIYLAPYAGADPTRYVPKERPRP